jgi:hypothetical protein
LLSEPRQTESTEGMEAYSLPRGVHYPQHVAGLQRTPLRGAEEVPDDPFLAVRFETRLLRAEDLGSLYLDLPVSSIRNPATFSGSSVGNLVLASLAAIFPLASDSPCWYAPEICSINVYQVLERRTVAQIRRACVTISTRTCRASAGLLTSRKNAMRAPRVPSCVFKRT